MSTIINKVNNRELRVYIYKVFSEGLVYNDVVYQDDNWTLVLYLTRDTADLTASVQYKNGGNATDKIVVENKILKEVGSKRYTQLQARSLNGYLNLTQQIESLAIRIKRMIDQEKKRVMGGQLK